MKPALRRGLVWIGCTVSSWGGLVLPSAWSPAAIAQTRAATNQTGMQLQINGRAIAGQWVVEPASQGSFIWIEEVALRNGLGLELLPGLSTTRQAIRWFSDGRVAEGVEQVPARRQNGRRFLEVSSLARRSGWSLAVLADQLVIQLPAATLRNLRDGQQGANRRLVLDFDRPTPWEWDAIGQQLRFDGSVPAQLVPSLQRYGIQAEQQGDRTSLRLPAGLGVRVSSLGSPDRIFIDLPTTTGLLSPPASLGSNPAPLTPAPPDLAGTQLQQRQVTVDGATFPVFVIQLDLRQPNVRLAPIWAGNGSLEGTQVLQAVARDRGAAIAINAGFFNRNNRLPLGAIRRDNIWYSGPILNRGAMAWNDQGEVLIDRLGLQETLQLSSGTRIPLVALNSGYVRAGAARYTEAWGNSYQTILDNEVVVTVQGDRVVSQSQADKAGSNRFTIPRNGYLIVLRSANSLRTSLVNGTTIQVLQQAQPSQFDRFPHALGGGPLLVKSGRVVVNPQAEGFSRAFEIEAAPRSAIGLMPDGRLVLVAAHEQNQGQGPTLPQMAAIMQQLGVVDALNFDGGSSTSLVVNGQLVNRARGSAARVHNGLGVFLGPTTPASLR
ncbi:phosphodiester glycosidase family protein [Synechococcus elongatus]|uniref:phosphodiester glycosidase family protein n=1 Tax=Synechococcus elongatus TaxID=32046 RepID=UPI000F7EC46B|nr:phosphodiester glycosidase family protein [Synechococcus elongatus]